MDRKDLLIRKLEEYIKFLESELNDLACLAWIHDFESDDITINEGIRLRKEIEELRK